ncbi:MAG TPA: AbrB/MazE/SpoVT family DNA-binding domain-containing protein [Gemmatimonadota bacterium]|nr:AbrB/MazE/SpoVT family DNA-binding domain-containing protein [Gemmatimonadota bacterium]
MKTKITERGQVTIPKYLRERLGLRAGQVLVVREEGGEVVMTKQLPLDPLENVTGIVDLGGTTDEVLTELRGEPDAR